MFKLFLFKPRIRYDILIFNQKEDIVKLIGYHKDSNANPKRISTHVLWV